MQDVQEQNFTPDSEISNTQLSYPKRIELWSGRLAMVGFMTTVAVMVLNAGY
jgi:hypothetical protein